MRRIGLFVGAIVVCSCHGTDSTALGTFIGRYSLVAVDNQPLPFRGASAFVVRGDVDVRNGGRYTLTQVDSIAAGAVTTISSGGQWALQENAIALVDDAGPLQLGVISSDTLRMAYRGHENVYLRR